MGVTDQFSKFSSYYDRPNTYPWAIRKEPHGQYQMYKRPTDYMVKYSPTIVTIGDIEPSYQIGKFDTEDLALLAVESHHGTPQRSRC